MSKNDGIRAFPFEASYENGSVAEHLGMTLRDYFAGQALIALYSSVGFISKDGVQIRTGIQYSEVAYEIADAMIIARETK